MPTEPTLQKLSQRFGPDTLPVTRFRDNCRMICPRERIAEVLQFLKDECGFDLLVDVTAIDYSEYPQARDRFGVVYSLANTATRERLFVKVLLNEPDLTLPTAVPLWEGANWLEREVFDMFGIRFDGHPDLRRILLPEEFTAFPLRKDYPLRGRGERHNFPRLTRAEG
jgi:NADH-quinone oxidoreductase subunit C